MRTIQVGFFSLLFVFWLSFMNQPNLKGQQPASDALEEIRNEIIHMTRAFPGMTREEKVTLLTRFLQKHVVTEALCRKLLDNFWFTIVPERRDELVHAIARGLALKAVDTWYREGFGPRAMIEVITGRRQWILKFKDGEKSRNVVLKMSERGIEDIVVESFSLRQHHARYVRKLIQKYPIQYAMAELMDADRVIIDDFESSPSGRFPAGWKWLPRDEDKEKLYVVVEENGNRYLKAKDRGASVIIGRQFRWNVHRYPYLSWRWRVHSLPPGGDERYTRTNDSAAGVYVTFSRNFLGIPKSIKYVWSTTLPVGMTTRRSGIGRPWVVVARSGTGGLKKWHKETFNVLEAYRKIFGQDPPQDALAIGVLTDANSTHSYAEADYDDFMLLKKASAGSGVKQIVKGGN